MKKTLSLIKASMTEDMQLFKYNSKSKSPVVRMLFPIIIALLIMILICSYSNNLIVSFKDMHMEYFVLMLFAIGTTILTLIEGVYKSSSLLFKCKDDNLVLALPVKKSTILLVRLFKFYLFELLYNGVFLLPAIISYAYNMHPSASYYIVSVIALLLLPIIPIAISCIIGTIISSASSKFKYKNIVQIVISFSVLLVVIFFSSNSQLFANGIADNATNINNIINKVYYPVGAYISLITDFNIIKLLIFIAINIGIFSILIFILSKVYFKINSNVKAVKTSKSSKNYKVTTNKPLKSIIKKEIGKFFSSPVFVVNAGFGLILYIILTIVVSVKFDGVVASLNNDAVLISLLNNQVVSIAFILLCVTAMMTSITSSMISLEGKSFNILKSIPTKPYTIILGKVLAAVVIMLPLIIVGDMIMFIRFKFNILEILLILISSIIIPLVAELIGIIINLKYPKMNARNDTEAVKQSMSSFLSVIIGIFLALAIVGGIVYLISLNIKGFIIVILALVIFIILCLLLMLYLKKRGTKLFKAINV